MCWQRRKEKRGWEEEEGEGRAEQKKRERERESGNKREKRERERARCKGERQVWATKGQPLAATLVTQRHLREARNEQSHTPHSSRKKKKKKKPIAFAALLLFFWAVFRDSSFLPFVCTRTNPSLLVSTRLLPTARMS
jgi:hypothetical protein